jgi:thiamine biosynthesis lipoprotein
VRPLAPLLAAALPLAAAAAGPAGGPADAVATEARPAMGTLCSVTLAGVDPARARAGFEAAFAVFARVDEAMNEWRAESPLSALNDAAGGGWVALPADLCEVLAAARDGAARTGGRFDPTWAALSDLWRFDGVQASPPAEAELAARCPLVGHGGLWLAAAPGGACWARLARPGMRVGLGGVAKGWAVDEAARALRALGFRDFLLQAGGDLYAAGRRGAAPWRVAVRAPHGGPLDALATLDVEDAAFSTSGDSERFFEQGGRRYHHVLDPRTCRPARGGQAATVLAPTALQAEVLSKAVLVEGPGGLALASAAGAEALLVDGDGRLHATPALAARLRPAGAP